MKIPLHKAASMGLTNAMSLMIDRDAEVNAVDYFGDTPLHSAARAGMFNAVRLLVKHGADISVRNNLGKTPMNLAAEASSTESVVFLREAAKNQELTNHVDDAKEDEKSPVKPARWWSKS